MCTFNSQKCEASGQYGDRVSNKSILNVKLAYLCLTFRLITKFPHLKCDVEKVFEILTEGRADVNILFQLSHPECVENFNSILIQALLYGKDLKGEQR